jgi:hypothetical protein
MLAGLCKKTQDSIGSIFWYGKALETVVEDPLTSGSAAIAGLVEQKGLTELSADEKALCEKVLKQAWKLFSLPGQPELENLHAAIGVLDEASTRPLPGSNCGAATSRGSTP